MSLVDTFERGTVRLVAVYTSVEHRPGGGCTQRWEGGVQGWVHGGWVHGGWCSTWLYLVWLYLAVPGLPSPVPVLALPSLALPCTCPSPA